MLSEKEQLLLNALSLSQMQGEKIVQESRKTGAVSFGDQFLFSILN